MIEQKSSIKNWSEEDRPREKLSSKGSRSLTNSELLAILIGSGNKEESAVELSRRILNCYSNNINELAKLEITDLLKFKGIGEAKAINIIAALEIGRRRKEETDTLKVKITSSKDAFGVIAPHLMDLPHEEFWILLLNRANQVIEPCFISKGGLSSTIVDVRIILKKAIDKLANSIIICHNHPSGNKNISDEDLKVTAKIKEAAINIDINVLDHIIICGNTYISLADQDKL